MIALHMHNYISELFFVAKSLPVIYIFVTLDHKTSLKSQVYLQQ